jgi:hypothetical protein
MYKYIYNTYILIYIYTIYIYMFIYNGVNDVRADLILGSISYALIIPKDHSGWLLSTDIY